MGGKTVSEFQEGWSTGRQADRRRQNILTLSHIGSSLKKKKKNSLSRWVTCAYFYWKSRKIFNNIGARNYLKIFLAYSNAPVPLIDCHEVISIGIGIMITIIKLIGPIKFSGGAANNKTSIDWIWNLCDTQSSAGDKFLKFVSGYCSRASIERNIDT